MVKIEDATEEDTQHPTIPAWYADDIRTQKMIDGFYDCIAVAQQRYKDGVGDLSTLVEAMELVKSLQRDDLPF